MSDKFFHKQTSLSPSELARLQVVFDLACLRRNISIESKDAEDVAALLLDLYQHGIREEEQLLAMLNI